MKKKVCIKCGKEKDLSGFRLRKDTGKYRNSCFECDRDYHRNRKKDYKKHYQKYKNKIKCRVKRWRVENPEKVRKNREQEKSNVRDKARIKKEKKLVEECKIFNLGVKKCRCCGEEKDFDCFYFRKEVNDFGLECKKCCNQKSIIYSKKNKEIISKDHKEYNKEYEKKNRKLLNKKERDRRRNDIQYKISSALRSRLYTAIRGKKKVGSAVRDLGCSVGELIVHLENQFTQGMAWDNYGRWHIDHIIPLSSFDLTDRQQIIKACHYTNLQPLWAEDNLKKGSKIL